MTTHARNALAAALAVVLAVPALAQEPPATPASLALGATAPMSGERMRNVDGKDVTLRTAKGKKGLLVVFSCNSCPWAKAWEERIVELGNEYSKQGIGVVMVNPNDPGQQPEDRYEVMQQRAKQRGMKFPYAVDATSGVAKAFGATKTPEAFLFDASGKLVYKGAIDDNAKQPDQVQVRYLKDALDAVVAGVTPATAESKAIGCTIKFRKGA
jgi:peroxiredoxin